MSPEKAFTQQQKDAMVAAIKQAEKTRPGKSGYISKTVVK